MDNTKQTLLEQMGLNEYEIDQRKQLFGFTLKDASRLHSCQSFIKHQLDSLIEQFHRFQTGVPEIVQLINDADTLQRLSHAQSQYITELFSGEYGLDYVHNRLRIGIVHKRIGVEPKLYLSAILQLKNILFSVLATRNLEESELQGLTSALEKLLMFDNTLIFDTYIHALVSEVQIARQKSVDYARELEHKVQERTEQLEELSRTDPLTGLLNVRHLQSIMNQVLKAAQRRDEPVSFVYLDIDDFKPINDEQGHQAGDEILKGVADIIRRICREEDRCFRYGGDEFCILLPNCDATHARQAVCERIRQVLTDSWPTLKVSMGLVETCPPNYLSSADLIRLTDEAMYAEKKQHKAATQE
ncbi:GGDEF domain-containing protein [Shewanella sp. GXUN23E]|uniref:GGDEF domain-containing protein n=1 Tax=Shewanella sp. GXUN23E TaxID=3422498 RepID=UPI003D7F161F